MWLATVDLGTSASKISQVSLERLHSVGSGRWSQNFERFCSLIPGTTSALCNSSDSSTEKLRRANCSPKQKERVFTPYAPSALTLGKPSADISLC
jgi:hypothetical protein